MHWDFWEKSDFDRKRGVEKNCSLSASRPGMVL